MISTGQFYVFIPDLQKVSFSTSYAASIIESRMMVITACGREYTRKDQNPRDIKLPSDWRSRSSRICHIIVVLSGEICRASTALHRYRFSDIGKWDRVVNSNDRKWRYSHEELKEMAAALFVKAPPLLHLFVKKTLLHQNTVVLSKTRQYILLDFRYTYATGGNVRKILSSLHQAVNSYLIISCQVLLISPGISENDHCSFMQNSWYPE